MFGGYRISYQGLLKASNISANIQLEAKVCWKLTNLTTDSNPYAQDKGMQ